MSHYAVLAHISHDRLSRRVLVSVLEAWQAGSLHSVTVNSLCQ